MPASITSRGYIRVVHQGFDGTLTAWRNRRLSRYPDTAKMLCDLFNQLILVGNFKPEDWFPRERAKLLVRNLVWPWLEHKRRRPATVSLQERIVKNIIIPAVGNKSIKELTRQDFWWIRENHGDTHMAQLVRRTAQAFLNWCWREGLMDRQLFLPVISVPKKATPYIEARDRWRIHGAMSDRYKDCALLSIEMGMRIGEIVALRWDAIDFNRDRIRVIRSLSAGEVVDMPKGGDEVWLPMTERVRAMLSRRREGRKSHWVFPAPMGNHVWPFQVRMAWKEAARECGLPHAKLHYCRHSFAQDRIEAGDPLEVVSALLGHRSIRTTERYKGFGLRKLRRVEKMQRGKLRISGASRKR